MGNKEGEKERKMEKGKQHMAGDTPHHAL